MGDLYHGDCIEVMRSLPPDSVDAIVTDPPYHLTSIVKRFGVEGSAPAKGPAFQRHNAGFMGKAWDGGGVAFDPATWAEALRVLKPGGHLVAFGGTRTYHRMVCAIEDAGFEIRDCIAWLYGSGFPKRHDQLKPGYEPIVVARKPAKGARGFNVEACRIGSDGRTYTPRLAHNRNLNDDGWIGIGRDAEPVATQGRWPANVILDEESAALLDEQSGERPSGALDRTRITVTSEGYRYKPALHGSMAPREANTGGASRFFYTAKADAAERSAGLGKRNSHPTVKPVDLMGWLIRLVTPPGGVVLDPFGGSGTTAIAAIGNGFDWVLIEREAEYVAIAEQRIGLGCQSTVA